MNNVQIETEFQKQVRKLEIGSGCNSHGMIYGCITEVVGMIKHILWFGYCQTGEENHNISNGSYRRNI